jgi:hypothetical protein
MGDPRQQVHVGRWRHGINFERKYVTPGTYDFFCTLRPHSMQMTIVVKHWYGLRRSRPRQPPDPRLPLVS